MTAPWSDDIERLRGRLGMLIERANLGDDTREVASEALEELAVVVEELHAQNTELIVSRTDLEEERERYRDLFETVPDGYVVTDSLGTVREINATAVELFGRPRQVLVGKPLGSLVEETDRRAFYAQLSRIRHEGPGTHMTINLMVQDGVAVPANLRATVAASREDDESEIRWLVHDRRSDIATRDLRTSEERLRSLFDAADVGIVLADGGGTVVFANQSADAILDRKPEAVSLDEWLIAVHPDDAPRLQEALRATRVDGRPQRLRHRLIAADGTTRWVDHGINSAGTRDAGPNGSVSTITDVTDENTAVARLEESRDFTEALLDTVGALVIVLTPSGHIERFNAACETTTAFAAGDMIGRHFLEAVVPVDQHDEVARAFGDFVSRGENETFENDWITADGSVRTISWTNTAMRAPDGSVQVVIGTGIDVTETRLLEARLAQADRLESIGRLAAGIAHDFNNTLAALRLRFDRIAGRAIDDSSGTDVAAASATIDRTQHLIADLLSFSRQQAVVAEPVEINPETERVVSMLDDLLGEHIVVELDLTEDSRVTEIDSGRFEQMLTNLVINARDSMPSGGTVTITTSIDDMTADNVPTGTGLAAGSYVRLVVSDTGTGIDPADTPRVFDPYFTTKPPGRGTGLGLATTYGTVTQAGGAIIVESRPGSGTSFTVWLPCTTAEAVLPPSRGAERQSRIALVVEDDPDMQEVLVDELQRLGYETLVAETGEQALHHLGANIDLLISDVQLPGINGAELAREFEASLPGLKPLYISGATTVVLERTLPDGANVVAKPFTVDQLTAAITLATAGSDS